jgi:hypothetical protein
MNAAKGIKALLSIAVVFLVGYVLLPAYATVVSRVADKIFGSHVVLRFLVAAAILLFLGWLLFRKRGTASIP